MENRLQSEQRTAKGQGDATTFIRWMRQLACAFDYLFILRPTLFFPVWTIYGAGYFAALRANPGGDPVAPTHDPLAFAISLTLLMGSVFILNQIVDARIDRENNKLFLVANGHIPKALAIAEALLLLLVALAIALAGGLSFVVLSVAIFIVTGVLYSLPPFKFKDRPIAGLVTNSLGAVLIFMAGWWAHSMAFESSLLRAVPYAAAVAAVYIYTTLLDKSGDAQFQKITFAVKFGDAAAIWFGALLEVVSFAAAWWFYDAIIFYPALFSAPLFLWAAIRRRQQDVIRAIKWPILFLAIFVCFLWPPYFLILLFTFYFAKWYYYFRFDLIYPSLESR